MGSAENPLAPLVADIIRARFSGAAGITGFRRLSGGAMNETFALDVLGPDRPLPLVLRRAPGGRQSGGDGLQVPLEIEAEAMTYAQGCGILAPEVRYVLQPEDGIGQGYFMIRIEGETLARRILRDPEFFRARKIMARQCGETMAKLHRLDPAKLPPLKTTTIASQIDFYRGIYEKQGHPHPVMDFALRWLEDHMPCPDAAPTFVHGDFRNGNIMVGPDGLRAVLDWENIHMGDPMEDLGWICINSWRFGNIDLPVGGFGILDDLFSGYESVSGEKIDRDRFHYWHVFSTLKWGIQAKRMIQYYRSGIDRSVERLAIARRTSETEVDLLRLLAPRM